MHYDREYKRYSPRSSVQAIDGILGDTLGYLINISKGGFLLACQGKCPQPSAIYQLHILDADNHAPDFHVGATCLWRDEASAANSHWCGFQIIDISPQDKVKLNDYIETLM